MRLNWWETFAFIVFVALFLLSVIIPWLTDKLVYDKLVFGVIFAIAIIIVSTWTTIKFSRNRPKRDLKDNSQKLAHSSPEEYKEVFPHHDEDKRKRVAWVVVITIFILLLLVYMYQRGDVAVIQEFLMGSKNI